MWECRGVKWGRRESQYKDELPSWPPSEALNNGSKGYLPEGMNGSPTGTNRLHFQVAHVYPERVPSDTSLCDFTEGQGRKWEYHGLRPGSDRLHLQEAGQSLGRAGHSAMPAVTEVLRYFNMANKGCLTHGPSPSLPAIIDLCIYTFLCLDWRFFEDRNCILSLIPSMNLDT